MPRVTQEPEMPNLQWIKLALIDTATQVRTSMDKARLQELADDIRARGLLQPIIVRPCGERFRVIAGHRRRFACEIAGLDQVPAMVGDATDDDVTEMQLVENLQREDLSDEDIGQALAKLYDVHHSLEAVALLVNKSKPWVAKKIKIATRLHWRAAELFQGGVTEDGDFLCALSDLFGMLNDYQETTKVCEQVRAGELDRDGVRELLARLKARRDAPPVPAKPQREKKPKPRNNNTLARELYWSYRYEGPHKAFASWSDKERENFLECLTAAYQGGAATPGGTIALARLAHTGEMPAINLARIMGHQGADGDKFTIEQYLEVLNEYLTPAEAEESDE